MSRSVLALALVATLLAPACRKGPTYDDAPIARADRPRATRKDEPKVQYDREEVCKHLGTIAGTNSMTTDEQADLHDLCLKNLEALEGRNRKEFGCRCKCILAAPDIGAIELCQRRCVLENIDEVCHHAVGSQEQSNDAGVVDDARKVCAEKLARLKTKDDARFECTIRCLMLANGKDDSLLCDDRCDPKNVGKTLGDAGRDAERDAEPPSL